MILDWDKITEELQKPLDKKYVKPPAPGKYGDYIEGWRAIDEANRIFGFGGWSRDTFRLEETNRDLVTVKKQRRDGTWWEEEQWRVGYLCQVRVIVGDVVRIGTGFGTGIAKAECLGDALESAAKEAETDATKRALMTFGNPFGLALYDKEQANVVDVDAEEAAAHKFLARQQKVLGHLQAITSMEELQGFWSGLNKEQPDMVRDTDVLRAKEEMKASLQRDAA